MSKPSLLLVDDDDGLRGLMALSLAADYGVYQAANRSKALEILQQEADICLMLLDLGMPPKEHSADEGLALLDALNDMARPMKVVVLTGQNPEASAFMAIKHGAFDFLAKPVDVSDVKKSLERAWLFLTQEKRLQNEDLYRVQLDIKLGDGVKTVRNQAEEKLVRQVLQETQFNVHESARRLGIKRENVYYLMKKYGLVRQGEEE